MKRQKPFKYPPARGGKAAQMKEEAVAEPIMHINVRAAKDQLSSLLEDAAQGNEIVITSDGKPKAKLVPVKKIRKAFRVDWELLRSMPVTTGPSAEELVREDRDARP